jgi:hypothetical protein
LEENLNRMNSVLDEKSKSVPSNDASSMRTLKLNEKHALAFLGFFTVSGLLYVLMAVFTTMLSHNGWRDLWLALTITLFSGMLVGITFFFLSYQPHQPDEPR